MNRQELILSHLDRVEKVAQRLKSRRPWARLADLRSDGRARLVELAGTWDPSRGIDFGAYITPRLRWAMIDGMRARAAQRHCCVGLPVALDGGEVIAAKGPGPADTAEQRDLGDWARGQMTLAERQIVTELYDAGRDLAGASASMGWSRGGICRAHTRMIRRLQKVAAAIGVLLLAMPAAGSTLDDLARLDREAARGGVVDYVPVYESMQPVILPPPGIVVPEPGLVAPGGLVAGWWMMRRKRR